MTYDAVKRHRLVQALALYIASLVAAMFTEWLSGLSGTGLSLWLPAGLMIAVLAITPTRRWPLWLFAGGAAEATGNILWYHHDWVHALIFICGNLLAALVAGAGIRRYVRGPFFFASMRSAALFLAFAALAGPLVSAAFGTVALSLSYDQPTLAAWPRIVLGDAAGTLVAAPLMLLVLGRAARPLSWPRRRIVEAAAAAAGFAALAAITLGGLFPFAFMMIPPLLWCSLRFGTAGGIAAATVLTILTIGLTAMGVSAFFSIYRFNGYNHEAIKLFLLVTNSIAILTGALSEEHRLAMRRLSRVNMGLERQIADRTLRLTESEARATANANLLTAIGEACPDVIFAKDCELRIIYANTALGRIYGLEPEDIVGHNDAPLMHMREEYEALRAHDEQVLATQQPIIVEERVTSADGTMHIYRTSKAPLYDASGMLSGLAGVAVDITAIKQAEARERMLVREVEHRARNLLAMVQGLVQLTSADSMKAYKDALSSKIRALARTNGAIAAAEWQGAPLDQILRDELAPFDDDAGRILFDGPSALLDPVTAQSMTLVIHELATNSAKYGALSTESGQLSVDWSIVPVSEGARPPVARLLTLVWTERGGPPVVPPERAGFGTTVITTFGEERPGGSVDFAWDPQGLSVTLRLPLTGLTGA